jgi:hypothetical protein
MKKPVSKALAMGDVAHLSLDQVRECRLAAMFDVSVGALSPRTANALSRQLGERIRAIKRETARD